MTSSSTYNDEAVGDDPVMTFTNLRVVDDAGGHHIAQQRAKIERWSRQLINELLPEDQRDPEARRAAVLGNLSIRLNPKMEDLDELDASLRGPCDRGDRGS